MAQRKLPTRNPLITIPEFHKNFREYRYGSNLEFLTVSQNFIDYRGCGTPLLLFHYCRHNARTLWTRNSKVCKHIWFDNLSEFPKFQVDCSQLGRIMMILRSGGYFIATLNKWSPPLINRLIGSRLLIEQQPKRYNANIFYFKESRYQYSLKVIRSSSPNMFGTT